MRRGRRGGGGRCSLGRSSVFGGGGEMAFDMLLVVSYLENIIVSLFVNG